MVLASTKVLAAIMVDKTLYYVVYMRSETRNVGTYNNTICTRFALQHYSEHRPPCTIQWSKAHSYALRKFTNREGHVEGVDQIDREVREVRDCLYTILGMSFEDKLTNKYFMNRGGAIDRIDCQKDG